MCQFAEEAYPCSQYLVSRQASHINFCRLTSSTWHLAALKDLTCSPFRCHSLVVYTFCIVLHRATRRYSINNLTSMRSVHDLGKTSKACSVQQREQVLSTLQAATVNMTHTVFFSYYTDMTRIRELSSLFADSTNVEICHMLYPKHN
jgi:hypothetical protein